MNIETDLKNDLTLKEWLELNAKLQKKKNDLRKKLKEKGVLKKGKSNDYDHYKYFSEAQYKELFTELYSEVGLELKFDLIEDKEIAGTDKQPFGKSEKLRFRLFDIETGFYEDTEVIGEALDKGDKASYKAYTGALKYYLSNTFMVATGDDPENESPDGVKKEVKATEKQIAMLIRYYQGDNLPKLLDACGVKKIEDISLKKASELISACKKREEEKKNGISEN